jgi:hypothetical protein
MLVSSRKLHLGLMLITRFGTNRLSRCARYLGSSELASSLFRFNTGHRLVRTRPGLRSYFAPTGAGVGPLFPLVAGAVRRVLGVSRLNCLIL